MLNDPNYSVYLTREGNIDVRPKGPVNWRWEFANEKNGDLFISFHLDSTDKNAVFAIRQEGKTNEKESERFAQFILNKLSLVVAVDRKVRNVKGATNYSTLGVLNNFGGRAGVLFEFGGINSTITTTIKDKIQEISEALKAGIDEYVTNID